MFFAAPRLPEWMSGTDQTTLRRYPQRVKEALQVRSYSSVSQSPFWAARLAGRTSDIQSGVSFRESWTTGAGRSESTRPDAERRHDDPHQPLRLGG